MAGRLDKQHTVVRREGGGRGSQETKRISKLATEILINVMTNLGIVNPICTVF